MSDELHIMSLVTLLDAVHADGVAIGCVTGVTPVGTQVMFVTKTKRANSLGHSGRGQCKYKHKLPVKIVHWVAGVT